MVESVISERLTEAITRLPEETRILHQEIQTLREDMKRGLAGKPVELEDQQRYQRWIVSS